MYDKVYPKRKNHRLQNFEYGAGYSYHAVMNVKKENVFLSKIVEGPDGDGVVILSDIGKTVDEMIKKADNIYPGVNVDAYAIMPRHIHLLITIEKDENSDGRVTLNKIVASIKSFVTKKYGEGIWQRSYYDTVLNNEKSFFAAIDYINANPVEHINLKKQIKSTEKFKTEELL